MDCSKALVTVIASDPEMPFVVATALNTPVETPVARPVELTTPTDGV